MNNNWNYRSNNTKSIKRGGLKKKRQKKKKDLGPVCKQNFKTEGLVFVCYLYVFACVCAAMQWDKRGNIGVWHGGGITGPFLSGRWGWAAGTWRVGQSRGRSGRPWCPSARGRGCPPGGPGRWSASQTPAAAGRRPAGSSAAGCWPPSDPGCLRSHLARRPGWAAAGSACRMEWSGWRTKTRGAAVCAGTWAAGSDRRDRDGLELGWVQNLVHVQILSNRRGTHRWVGVRQLLRRPILVPLALLLALSAFVAAPVAAALVAGWPGRLLHDSVHALTRHLG